MPAVAPVTTGLRVLGMPGFTAYGSMRVIACCTTSLAVQAERQRVIGTGHGAIAIGLRRAVDIAECCGPQRLDGHGDVFGRADGEPDPHCTEAAPRVVLVLQQGPRHIAHAVVDAAATSSQPTEPQLADIRYYEADAFQQNGGQWLLVSHAAWRVPQ